MLSKIKYLAGTVCIGLVLAAPVRAEVSELSMADFAQGTKLTSANAEYRRFTLSPIMIKDIRRRDLGDIRVFDANNDLMPLTVRITDSHIKTYRQPLRVITRPKSYMLDRGENYQHWMKSIHLKWKQDSAPKVLSVRVEHSADQIEWKMLKKTGVVSNYQFANTMIRHNAIDINDFTERYIRLVLLQRQYNAHVLESAQAYLKSEKPPEPSWISAGNLQPITGEAGSYTFSTSEGITPRWLRLHFSELNTALSGSLYTITTTDGKQQRKLISDDFNAYKVTLNNNVIRSRPLNVSRIEASEWVIVVKPGSEIATNELPTMMVAYPPYEVVFAAKGSEPYTVVWGHTDAGPPEKADITLNDNIAMVHHGRIVGEETLEDIVKTQRLIRIATLSGLALLLVLAAGSGYFVFQRFRQRRQVKTE